MPTPHQLAVMGNQMPWDFALAEVEAAELTDANIQAFTDSLTKKVRKRILRWMVKNNILEPEDARDMLTWQGPGTRPAPD